MSSFETTKTSPLTIQITTIATEMEKLRSSMQEDRAISMFPFFKQQVNQLTGRLDQLKKQVSAADDELRNLRGLASLGQIVNSSLDPDVVLRIVMDTIVRLNRAERGFLMLRSPQGEFTIRIARNWEQESINPSDFAISRTVVNRVVSESKPILTTNAQEDPRFGGQESIVAYNLRSIMCVPLVVKSELIGVIYADNRIRSGIFSQAELELLTNFANQAAVAIENARLFASVRHTLAEVTEIKNTMDNIFASIASGVITADVEEKVMLVNRAAEVIFGSVENEMIGKTLGEMLPPLASILQPALDQVLRSDQPVIGLEVSPALPPRGSVDLLFNLSPLKDAFQVTQGVAIVVEDLTEKKKLEAQRRLFERMVSPAVIDQLDPNGLQLGGKRSDITVLFADIRGFTSFCDGMEPDLLVAVLNNYLAAAAESILQQEGTIDKFLGDAVMAWFNAPIPQVDHTLRAVKAAISIRDSVLTLHKGLPDCYHLSFGLGIHYGDAVLGLVGTEKRLEYTAIGDSVNTAKRIQENSGGGQILISEAAYERVRHLVNARPVEPIQAKGKRDPLVVYEIIDLME